MFYKCSNTYTTLPKSLRIIQFVSLHFLKIELFTLSLQWRGFYRWCQSIWILNSNLWLKNRSLRWWLCNHHNYPIDHTSSTRDVSSRYIQPQAYLHSLACLKSYPFKMPLANRLSITTSTTQPNKPFSNYLNPRSCPIRCCKSCQPHASLVFRPFACPSGPHQTPCVCITNLN